jgi:hypothetical protein
MFCRNCGNQIPNEAVICVRCGVAPHHQAQRTDHAPPVAAYQSSAPAPAVQGYQPGAAVFPRGPIGEPVIPYRPETFSSLYLWFAILAGVSIPLMFVLIGFVTLIAAGVFALILLFKAWNQIQDGYQRTSAGNAVGFCFIPFFNFYWHFVAYYGLAQDVNAYARRYQIAAPPVSEGLALTHCILCVCSIIPYLGLLAALAALVIVFILLHQIKAASVAIAHAKLRH